jgi:predicted lipid-binding transport protein (Tim44 family)
MKRPLGFLASALLGVALALSGADDAFAKRMGGGKSFGSRPSFSTPYQRGTPAPDSGPQRAPGMGQPGAPAQQPAFSPAQQRNQAMRDSFRQRGGLMGMLGGLALGGLLGALLFGGAFEGINFLDILLFGAVAFMLFKLFAARRRAPGAEPAAAGGYPAGGHSAEPESEAAPAYQRQAQSGAGQPGPAGFNTDLLFGGNRAAAAPTDGSAPAYPAVPADFDTPAFMRGAKSAYEMMQAAWDAGDLAELRALTTDKVFGELQDQLRARGNTVNRTELLNVDAELLEVRDVGNERQAAVLFDVLMREAAGEEPIQVREVWHFVRSKNSRQPTWFLDGIQQVEG